VSAASAKLAQPLGAGRAGAGASRRANYANSPLLASKTPPWRSRFLVALLAIGSLVLIGRAVWVQGVQAPFYVGKGQERWGSSMTLQADRGQILDRNGKVLARSVPVASVWMAPEQFREANPTAQQRSEVARLLGIPLAELDERARSTQDFVWVRRRVDEPVWEAIRALKLKGLYRQREFRRSYPEGETIAQVVGRTDSDEKGIEGIERQFNAVLKGTDGEHRVMRDGRGRVIDEMGERREPVNGANVELSIDGRLQFFTWNALNEAVKLHGARSGSAVVLDARSGEILALANVLGPAARERTAHDRQRNRALTDVFEPGSTMKPFIVAAAMQQRKLTPDTSIPNEALPVAGGLFVRDEHPLAGPTITLAQVVARSSNAGTARLAMKMDKHEMHTLLSSLGFGRRPEIEFPGAISGKLRKADSWMPIDQATMSYGYGLSTSLLQLARAYTVFARDGQLSELSIRKQEQPLSASPVFTPEVARSMRQMLGGVTQEGGTARKAYVEGYSVGGKTGTAQAHTEEGYDKSRRRAWFVGLAPSSDPRLIVAVMVDDPRAQNVYTGGAVAAPIFSQVVQHSLRTLGVEPDLEVRPRWRIKPDAAGQETP
jgi:cell division protein FtsI (penicillin-binding protein 3)